MDQLTDEEIGQMRTILGRIYGKSAVSKWTLNANTYLVLERMLKDSELCRVAMNFVPLPGAPIGTAYKFLQRQIRNNVLRFLSRDENEHYFTCLTALAAKYRTDFGLAGYGLSIEPTSK